MRQTESARHQRKRTRLEEKQSVRDLKRLDGRKKRHVLRSLLIALPVLLIAACAAGYFIFDVSSWQTLDMGKLTNLKQTGSIYDMNGEFVASLRGTENRVPVALETLPDHVKNAFIAAEDLRFYTHRGFDPVRIFGAVLANIQQGGYAEGASTITQQLIKLSHLSTQKTIARKLEEVWLAVQLERAAQKDDILEMYLNYVYFGRGAYGVQAAAKAYFGVDAASLSPAQAASLAAVIKAPSLYAPHLNFKANQERAGYILSTMRDNGMLDDTRYDAARAEDIALIEVDEQTWRYGWYLDAVLDEAESILSVGAETLLGGGYRIYTAFSPAQQDIIDGQFTDASMFPADASDGTRAQGAMASIDVKTGAVRAVVGGREYAVQRGLNRATQLRRQPGSALKPLAVYAPAIEYQGYTTASVLSDTPTKFGTYAPRNSGNAYYGYVTVRTALKYSLNIAAVAMLDKIGVNAARQYLDSCGIPLDERDSNLALALGAMTYGVSPVQLAAAYAPFANGGTYYAPYFIARIEDAQGRTLYEHETNGRRIISAQTAYLMTSLLQTVTASGTGAKLSGAGTPVAGKTGTVNMTTGGNRDIWMAAYNSQISTAFWMGFDMPDDKHKLSGWVSGGDYTAKLATAFFKKLYQGKDKPAFLGADNVVWLKIDIKSIEWAGEAMLATSLTPSAYTYSEVFAKGNQPTKKSNVWSAPRAPSGFYVTHNNAGNPVLVITPADTALYRIQRDAVGECFILAELSGTAGTPLYYTDKKAQQGVVYTYRVIPIHQELLNNGVLLEGKQAVQIAQAKAPSGASLLQDLSDFLFGVDRIEDVETFDILNAP